MTILAFISLAAFAIMMIAPKGAGYKVMPEYDFTHVMTWVKIIGSFSSLALALWVAWP